MRADSIARLKITLDNVNPTVLRRIEVPLRIRLDRLRNPVKADSGSSRRLHGVMRPA